MHSVFYVLVNMLLISVIFRFKAVVMDESQGSTEQVGAYTTKYRLVRSEKQKIETRDYYMAS